MKIIKIIITVLTIISLILSSIVLYQHNKINELSSDIENLIFDMQNEDEIIVDDFSTQITDINDLLNDKIVGVVYFGRDTCPFCSEFNRIIKDNIDLTNINIYKFDTDNWRDNSDFQTILDKYNITDVPSLIRIHSDFKIENYCPDENSTDEEIVASLNQFLSEKLYGNQMCETAKKQSTLLMV